MKQIAMEARRVEEEHRKKVLAKRLQEEKAGEEMAKRLQDEEREWQEARRKELEQKNKANCAICLENIEDADLIPLDKCEHIFHPDCIRQHMSVEIEARKFPLKCPSCSIELTDVDIREQLSAELQDKWQQYSLTKTVDSNPNEFAYCLTPDCKYVFVWEEETCTNDFTCPVCEKRYCLDCRCVFHEGKTCKQYRIMNSFTVCAFV
eukprot:TRINITY_DN2608_c0_g1_i1.p1 TRINITY_DN2608_c0_g1~~TRINITY_DN2608_c0_g1_i1.p1  ORF type:complete len:206 (-),score=63.00 TRINITY_DN2608_c0_g1_i1:178-795(-)